MDDRNALFQAAMPEIYQRCLVPTIFDPYAEDLCVRIAALHPSRILELAAGTGVLTARLAAAMPGTHITATDLVPPMVKASESLRLANVVYERVDAADIPYVDGSFDLVACQFGVMFFADKPQAFAEIWRVLSDDGHFIFNTWDSLPENRAPEIVDETLAGLFAEDPPQFLRQIPYGYYDIAAVTADLHAANLRVVQTHSVRLAASVSFARQLAEGFCAGTPVRSGIEARAPERLEDTIDMVEHAIEAEYGAGPFKASMRAYVIVAAKT